MTHSLTLLFTHSLTLLFTHHPPSSATPGNLSSNAPHGFNTFTNVPNSGSPLSSNTHPLSMQSGGEGGGGQGMGMGQGEGEFVYNHTNSTYTPHHSNNNSNNNSRGGTSRHPTPTSSARHPPSQYSNSAHKGGMDRDRSGLQSEVLQPHNPLH